MKVCISVKGRFHAFYLAKELQDHGYLSSLITTYPIFETIKYGIKKPLIKSLVATEVIERLWRKLPAFVHKIYNTQFLFHELCDYRISHHIPEDIDIFVAFSSSALHSFCKMRKKSNRTICVLERGSSHIKYQYEILREEYRLLGLEIPVTHHPEVIEKELKEYEEADYISVPSYFVKQSMLDKGISAKKIIHVPYGVNLENFKPSPKKDDIFRIIFCGNRSIRKGVPYLLQAFTELNLPRSELCFIGSESKEIKSFMRKYAASNIRCIGPFPEFELAKYYSQGSVFCLPSLEEGLAMVQPQAMACGLPVICTTNTGGADIIRDGQDGFVLPIRDVSSLKEKILLLYENSELCESMGASAKQHVSTGFTWKDYGDRMIAEYQRILHQ